MTLPFFSCLGTPARIFSAPINFTSKISYSLYLTNYTLIKYFLIEKLELASDLMMFALFWVLSYFVSYLTYSWIEQPFLVFRDRFTKKPIRPEKKRI
jgi:peptidoglycan/LPS O-acetylase OafA/YrhL